MADIEAVVWDMGGIIYMTPFELFDEVEEANGWPKGALPRGPFSPEGDPDYLRCSTGEITESEYWRRFEQASRDRGYPIDLRRAVDWTDGVRPEVIEAVERIDGRRRQATLSNDSAAWLGYGWWEAWPYAHLFDHLIDVVTLGVKKPDPRTYLTAAERLELDPGACLLVDDMAVNVEGAERAGMPGFFFDHTAPSDSCARLLERLGL